MLVVWVFLTLCCALVSAREDADDKLSRGRIQVRQTRKLVGYRGKVEEGGVEMSDEPAGVVEEKTKPKKKKTPEEIEAGK